MSNLTWNVSHIPKEYSVDTAVAGYTFFPKEAIVSLLKKETMGDDVTIKLEAYPANI